MIRNVTVTFQFDDQYYDDVRSQDDCFGLVEAMLNHEADLPERVCVTVDGEVRRVSILG